VVDCFHRYHASLPTGLAEVPAEIRPGLRDDAVLYAAGANRANCLRRTNADKRNAVEMVLAVPKCAQWSDREITRQCGVGVALVADVRKSICTNNADSPAPATRTVTPNGTTYKQKGKARPAAAQENRPPQQAETAVTHMDDLVAENAQIREEVADLKADLLAENEQMGRTFEADDQVKAALAEVARFKALAENAESTIAARSQEFNERARNVTYWKNRAENVEKQLAKTEVTGESSALRAENAELCHRVKQLTKASKTPQLKYQLGDARALHDRLNERCVQLTNSIAELEKANDVLVQRLGMQDRKDCPQQQPEVGIEDRDDYVLMELAGISAAQPVSASQSGLTDSDTD
jgi:hypothetical protein